MTTPIAITDDATSRRLTELGIELPPPSVPRGAYVPYLVSGQRVFIAGQAPRFDGHLRYAGKVGRDLDVAAGQQAARLCALNIVAQLQAACGGRLDRVLRTLRVAGVVNAPEDFTEHAKVLDGASNVLFDIFGERGVHVRIATGASSLPSNMAVEVEALFEIET